MFYFILHATLFRKKVNKDHFKTFLYMVITCNEEKKYSGNIQYCIIMKLSFNINKVDFYIEDMPMEDDISQF